MRKYKKIILGGAIAFVIILGVVLAFLLRQPKFELVRTGKVIPHNEEVFTQGFFFDQDGKLYEVGGIFGESAVYADVSLITGNAKAKKKLDSDVFGEGATILNGKLYVLTAQERVIFTLDPNTLRILQELPNKRDGWGLTTDGKSLIASDGTSKIYFMDADLKDERSITVKRDGKKLNNINELEYIEGYIFANIWKTDEIVVINPANGEVIQSFDFTDLYPKSERAKKSDVMNGIAYNKKTKKVYLTGKYWPNIYEFELKK